MKLVLFDIDGTLLRCGSSPERAFDAAFAELFQVTGAWGQTIAHGRTDLDIVAEIAAARLKRDLTAAEFDLLCQSFAARFAVELESDAEFRVLPGVLPLVERLSQSSAVLLGIQTGNLAATAALKLRRARLNSYFRFGGYGSDHRDRSVIVKRAIEQAHMRLPQRLADGDIIVIGDSPFDIAAGKSAGAVTVGVATGRSSRDTLGRSKPDLLLDSLEDSAALLQILSGG